MNKIKRIRRDSVDYDYDFEQVMDAAYEGEYDGELGQFDLPRFKKTDELIEKIWNEKYNDIDSWLEIPWTKEEKDMIFEFARNEAKLLDRIDIYNSRARYQSYDETRRVLKEIFGIDNKYLHDPKYDSSSNNKKEKGNKIRKFFYKCIVNNVYYISENPNAIKSICSKDKNIFVIEKVNNKFIDMKNGKSYLDKNIIGDKDSAIEYYNLIKNKKETKLLDNKTMKKINAKKEEIQKLTSDYKEKLKTLYAKKPLPDSISKKRSHKRDAFVSAFVDKRVKDWRQVLHIYLEWEGIIGYDDIIISYLENDEYDELREFLSNEGIYGYYYTIVDIFETGEVNIPDMDEEDYERFF